MNATEATAAPTDRPTSFWVYVPPPPLFVVAFLSGVTLQKVVPLAVPAGLVPAAQWVGAALLLAGALMVGTAPLLFLLRRTTIIPHASARTLITSGPFRLTRNPMYLGLALGHAGLALVLHLLWPLALLAIPVAILNVWVIPFEERRLTALFGDTFLAYARRVRRWV